MSRRSCKVVGQSRSHRRCPHRSYVAQNSDCSAKHDGMMCVMQVGMYRGGGVGVAHRKKAGRPERFIRSDFGRGTGSGARRSEMHKLRKHQTHFLCLNCNTHNGPTRNGVQGAFIVDGCYTNSSASDTSSTSSPLCALLCVCCLTRQACHSYQQEEGRQIRRLTMEEAPSVDTDALPLQHVSQGPPLRP